MEGKTEKESEAKRERERIGDKGFQRHEELENKEEKKCTKQRNGKK